MNPREGYVFDRLATHAFMMIAELIGGGALTEREAATVTNWVDSGRRYLVHRSSRYCSLQLSRVDGRRLSTL